MMETFSIRELFKSRIDQIWDNPEYTAIEVLKRGYAVQDEIVKNALLFIGINPSFSGKLECKSHFYNNEQEGNLYPYFRKFQDLSRKTGVKWAHLDLLYIRETNQKAVEGLFFSETGKHFADAQLLLAKEIIELAAPKAIVVSNSFARRLFQGRFPSTFDSELGTHIITEGTLKGIPVFFTSMLTGQRALDVGSYERLVWHVGKVCGTANK